jgi:hypothetical protein
MAILEIHQRIAVSLRPADIQDPCFARVRTGRPQKARAGVNFRLINHNRLPQLMNAPCQSGKRIATTNFAAEGKRFVDDALPGAMLTA